MTYISAVDSEIKKPIDAYGRIQVSNQLNLLSIKQGVRDETQIGTLITGTATSTHTPPYPQTDMQVLANGDKVIRQSKMYPPYQPGKSLIYLMTGTLLNDTSISNVRARIGPFEGLTHQ